MKICVLGIPDIALGKHNIRDPRLDQADKLVEAKKKTYVQVDIVEEKEALESDVIVVTGDVRPDLILKDLEFVETRLGREPQEAEKSVLLKLRSSLEQEQYVTQAGLSPEQTQAITAHQFYTAKPIVVASEEELSKPEELLFRAFQESSYTCFFTVGGKENRAWPVRKGSTAWEAAGAIHSDIQHGFIRAEIISFADLVQFGGETGAKRAGKLRLETKDYVMQDCDITNFRFNK